MSNFVKLYGSILDSTIWLESMSTRLVWITMLAMADWHGFVPASVPGLAKRAGVTRSECEAALKVLAAPDLDSRTPDHDGRRIEKVEGGWLVLNHRKYRDMRSDSQVATAERVRKHRAKRQRLLPVTDVTTVTPDVDLEVDVETEKEKATTGENIDLVLAHYEKLHPKRKIVGKKLRSVVERALKDFSAGELIEALNGNAFDPWHKERRKHELAYVLRDVDMINGFRERAGQPPPPASSNGTEARARAERLYMAFTQHGLCKTLPLEAHDQRIDELAAAKEILDPEHFKAEFRAVKPWTWLGAQRETDKEKSITRIAQAIATLQQPVAP